MARSQRHTIAPGIYRDASGIAGIVKVGTHPNCLTREYRFAPDTKVSAIKQWQTETRAQLQKQLPTGAARGSFTADVQTYYQMGSFVKAPGGKKFRSDRRRNLTLWIAVFGSRRRCTIRLEEINTQLQAWRASGLSAACVDHRRIALSQLFEVLDGRGQPNPAKVAIRFPKPDPKKRSVALALVDRIIGEIPTVVTAARRGKTIARLQLMRWTGARPAQLARLTADAFDLDADYPSVLIPSAKGGNASRIPLLSEGVAAARAFLATDCAGSFNTACVNRTIARACQRLDVPRITVYQLRHSVATHLRNAGTALTTIQDALGHTSATTTKIYAPPVTALQMTEFEGLRPKRMAPKDGTKLKAVK